MLVGQVLAHAADPAERGVHARPGDHLHEVHDHLALAHGVEQRGHRAEVHRQRAGDQEVAGKPRQLGHQHADVLRPLRRLDVEELLDRQREGEVVGGRAEIVQPVGQREDLGVGEALGQLLGAAVQIADVRIDALDDLASISSTSRRTPWVLGCCGPRLSSTSWVFGVAPAGAVSSVTSVIASPRVAGDPSYGMFLVARSGRVGGGPSAPKGFSSSL